MWPHYCGTYGVVAHGLRPPRTDKDGQPETALGPLTLLCEGGEVRVNLVSTRQFAAAAGVASPEDWDPGEAPRRTRSARPAEGCPTLPREAQPGVVRTRGGGIGGQRAGAPA